MIEQLSRLSETNSGSSVEVLERMLDASTPNFDLDDKLKHLLEKLFALGHHDEVYRCIAKLRKTLPGMVEFYKQLVEAPPKA